MSKRMRWHVEGVAMAGALMLAVFGTALLVGFGAEQATIGAIVAGFTWIAVLGVKLIRLVRRGG